MFVSDRMKRDRNIIVTKILGSSIPKGRQIHEEKWAYVGFHCQFESVKRIDNKSFIVGKSTVLHSTSS